MRRTLLLLLVFAGCAGPDSDPVDVAERFHALRVEGDDPGMYALLTDADRAAISPEGFPTQLPSRVMADVMGWGDAPVDSAALLRSGNDTAAVLLHIAGDQKDTLQLAATHHPRDLLVFEMDRVRWRVSMGLAERATLDSLAAIVREESRPTDSAAVAVARTYIEAAEEHPEYARPADLDAARSLLRAASVAEALEIDVRLSETIDGVPLVVGRVANPTEQRINTLVFTVRDATGAEESFELWDIGPGESQDVRLISLLSRGPVTHWVERIRVF